MKRPTDDRTVQYLPLNKLKPSPRNVRITPHSKAHIAALADSIEAHGQIQNLLVETEREEGQPTGCYLVTVGEGRRLAQLARVKRKKIKPDALIACVIDDAHNGHAVSLAENEVRQNMHPADQFAAFKTLVDTGQSIEDIAAQFSVTPLVVQRRLKLANVAPEFIEQYRKGGLALDLLMALALTDDHDKQRAVWKNLRKHERHPSAVRRLLTDHEISVREPVVKFVGLKAYEKAGGLIRRDLFAEGEHDGFVMDAELLQRLAMEKLEREAAAVKAEGHAWVEVIPRLDYAAFAEYGHVQRTHRAPTAEEAAKLTGLEAQLAQITAAADAAEDDEDRLAALDAQAEEIDAELANLREQLLVLSAEQQAVAGALVTISPDGKVRIERNLLKPQDAARFARAAKAAKRAAVAGGPRIHSAALVRRLAAHRTMALQVALCEQPTVALAALTHRLILTTFFGRFASSDSALQIELDESDLRGYGPDVDGSQALASLAAYRERLRGELPGDPKALLPWLLKQPEAKVLEWLAFCVAQSVNGVQSQEGPHAIDALTLATQLDMRKWWTPTAETYLSSIPKARILDVVREAVSPEAAASLTSLKKAPLAKAAEQRLAGTGWLPQPLRTHAA